MKFQSVIRVLESRSFFVFAVMVLRAVLDVAYLWFVSPVFAYEGFQVVVAPIKFAESWIILACLAGITPHRLRRPSDYLVTTFLITVLVPITSFYGLASEQRAHLYIILAGYGTMLLMQRLPLFRVPFVRHGFSFTLAAAIIGCIIVSIWFVYSGGIRYLNLDLSRVYEFRDESESLTNVGVMSYLNAWAMKVFGPLLLAIALLHRRWLLVAATVGLHVLWFGVSAHKSVLFFPLLIFFVWFWFRRTSALSIYAAGAAILTVACTAAYLLGDHVLPGSLFVRRSLFVVANNTFDYYDFFARHGHIWWSNSVLSLVVEYPYYYAPAEVIGEAQGTGSHVNTSFISTGFMHGGVLGVILYSILVGVLFRIVDSLAKSGLETWFCVAVVLIPMWALLRAADLFTALASHGVGMALLLLWLVRRPRRIDHRKDEPQSARLT